jgi:hypothetical protein
MQEHDGSLKVETVLSRRRLQRPDPTGQPAMAREDSLQLGRQTKSGSNIPDTVPARRDKYYYEYLVKSRVVPQDRLAHVLPDW